MIWRGIFLKDRAEYIKINRGAMNAGRFITELLGNLEKYIGNGFISMHNIELYVTI